MDQPIDMRKEMRKEMRFRMDAPALFFWDSERHVRLHGEGVTRDISIFGAFILTPACPPVNVPIQVEVVLPSLSGMKPVIRVSGTARVLRVEYKSDGKVQNGFAVVSADLTQWSLRRIKDEPTAARKMGVVGAENPVAFRAQRAYENHCYGSHQC